MAAILAAATTAGCATTPRSFSPYTTVSEVDRQSELSLRLTDQAVAIMDTDPDEAGALLRDALGAGLHNGRAHNNLGVLLLHRGRLHEAAGEFEWAGKLLPGHPDPRFNLAMTFEAAGRVDDALTMYETAIAVQPGHIQSIQSIQGTARTLVKLGRRGARLHKLLEEIAMRGDSATWQAWARRQLAWSAVRAG